MHARRAFSSGKIGKRNCKKGGDWTSLDKKGKRASKMPSVSEEKTPWWKTSSAAALAAALLLALVVAASVYTVVFLVDPDGGKMSARDAVSRRDGVVRSVGSGAVVSFRTEPRVARNAIPGGASAFLPPPPDNDDRPWTARRGDRPRLRAARMPAAGSQPAHRPAGAIPAVAWQRAAAAAAFASGAGDASSVPGGAWDYLGTSDAPETKSPPRSACSETCVAGASAASYYGRSCGLGYWSCPGFAPCDALDSCCIAHDLCCVEQDSDVDCACAFALRRCALCAAAAENASWTDAESAAKRGFGHGAPSTRRFALQIASVMSFLMQTFCHAYAV